MRFIIVGCLIGFAGQAAVSQAVTFEEHDGRLDILVDGVAFAAYVYQDDEILRPYFCNVQASNGVQVTRTHPPDPEADKDNTDHATFHPGIWLAFGDLGGADFWRMKARVRHLRFEQSPESGATGTFTVVNVYETLDTPPTLLCEETCTYTITTVQDTRWLFVDSRFRALDTDIAFGDQEEMGLGVRLATPLTVRHGSGEIVNSEGGVNEKGTWGQQADWCAYSGVVNGNRVGMMLMSDPANFRKSWFHNRDYGLMVANPFGKKSMTAPKERTVPPDATPLPQDERFTLGYAVCVFTAPGEQHPDYDTLYATYMAHIE